MKSVESGATASENREDPSPALVAGPPSPTVLFGIPDPQFRPDPATVVMIPSGVTLRTRWLQLSPMYSEPSGPSATPPGWLNLAWSAGPPSPENAPKLLGSGAGPLPAAVRRIPSGPIVRTR